MMEREQGTGQQAEATRDAVETSRDSGGMRDQRQEMSSSVHRDSGDDAEYLRQMRLGLSVQTDFDEALAVLAK